MTVQEAIMDIKENIKPVVGGKSLDIAIEALEKQIPKKPKDGSICLYCSECRHLLDGVERYCWFCGQKLDWGVSDD